MKKVTFTRHLKGGEIILADSVFQGTLPPWSEIGITNGLGKGDTVWTHPKEAVPFLGAIRVPFKYYINFGNAADRDLSTAGSLEKYVPGYPKGLQTPDVFIHELTHVWQYSREGANWASVAARCIYAQEIGSGYSYTAGDPWSDYNFEQQAQIVEDWNERSQNEEDSLFPYINYIIRRNRKYWTFSDAWFSDEADLMQLKVLLDSERFKDPAEPSEPIRITAKDDSFLVVLSGDVLFDFNKSDLKPAADKPLEQAQTKIKTNSRAGSVVYINGYTDSVGEDGYNVRLSEQRAQSVAQWFITRGYLTPSIVRTQGFGKSNPVGPNTTRDGRARNRRVEIYLANP